MNVLSLFDGMSCGQIALKELGIRVENYYASEIDKYAIKTTKENFPDTIHIGDVTKVKPEDIPEKIDMIIAGSPCQGFSFMGKQLNFEDDRSKLFFEFIRLIKELKPKYFMLENVRMKKESLDIISKYLGVKPTLINSSIFSAQNRERFYWTNIPFDKKGKRKNTTIQDIIGDEKAIIVHNLYGGFKEKKCRVFETKSPTIRTGCGGGHIPSVFIGNKEVAQNTPLPELRKKVRKLSIDECRKLQTIPTFYKFNVSDTQAYKMLGNGWTIEVIKHIFKGLK